MSNSVGSLHFLVSGPGQHSPRASAALAAGVAISANDFNAAAQESNESRGPRRQIGDAQCTGRHALRNEAQD